MKDPALVRGGAEFYWIAGLNAINVAMFFYGPLLAYVKLWAQFYVDDWAAGVIQSGPPAEADSARLMALGACAGFTVLFVALGYFSRRGVWLAFLAGVLLYLADTVATIGNVVYYLNRDGTLILPWWIMVLLHGYFSFILIGLLKASGKAPSSALADSMLNVKE